MGKIAVLQMCSGIDPGRNFDTIARAAFDAVEGGAQMLFTPEMSLLLDRDRARAAPHILPQEQSPFVPMLGHLAESHGITIAIGSMAVAVPGGRNANRSMLFGPSGLRPDTYDKIHMFDVDVSATETYRESAGYRPGAEAVLAQTPFGTIGMTICYDVRFAHLHRSLAKAGAHIITVPAAFSPTTGEAHWEVLLRARAIETGCFILAPAQTGLHPSTTGQERRTYGHSLAISPWGEVLVDAGEDEGVTFVDFDLEAVAKARGRVPSLLHDREISGPYA